VGIGWGDPMVAPRRVIALPTDAGQRQRLLEISRSRTEPTSRVERARIILAYLQDPSAYAVARTIGVTQQTVTRCRRRMPGSDQPSGVVGVDYAEAAVICGSPR
jgi:hypothetical protein